MNNETDPRIQKLINICYDLVLTATNAYNYKTFFDDKTLQERADWVTGQLDACGVPTEPCGSLWGVLKD